LDHVNRGKPTTTTTTSKTPAADLGAEVDAGDTGSSSSSRISSGSSRGQQKWSDLTLEQQEWVR